MELESTIKVQANDASLVHEDCGDCLESCTSNDSYYAREWRYWGRDDWKYSFHTAVKLLMRWYEHVGHGCSEVS